MMKELSDLPAGVVGFEVAGELKAEDYRDVVLPALERAAASGEVRFVVVIPEFHGMSVFGADGQPLGHVAGLAVQTEGMRVSEIIVKVPPTASEHPAFRGMFHAIEVHVPIEELESVGDEIVLAVTSHELLSRPRAVPEVEHEPL